MATNVSSPAPVSTAAASALSALKTENKTTTISVQDAIVQYYGYKQIYYENKMYRDKAAEYDETNAIYYFHKRHRMYVAEAEEKKKEGETVRACLGCKRKVGMLFSEDIVNDDGDRALIAVCGDKASPCAFHIHIQLGMRNPQSLDEMLLDYQKEINGMKEKLVRVKNDALFFGVSAMVSEFDKLTTELKRTTAQYGEYLEKWMLAKRNPMTAQMIEKYQVQLGEYIAEVKMQVNEFLRTNDLSNITSAVSITQNEIATVVKQLNELKYSNRWVHIYYEGVYDTFFKVEMEDMSADVEEQLTAPVAKKRDKVVKFITYIAEATVAALPKKTRKARKEKTAPTKALASDGAVEETGNKTRKRRTVKPKMTHQQMVDDIFATDSDNKTTTPTPPPAPVPAQPTAVSPATAQFATAAPAPAPAPVNANANSSSILDSIFGEED